MIRPNREDTIHFSSAICTRVGSLLLVFAAISSAAADDETWEKVQDILASTSDMVVLDGAERVPLESNDNDAPVYGDWLVRHLGADPPTLNPYTRIDAASGRVQSLIFESLLYAEHEPPYRLRGRLARDYPEISDDKLSYRFELRPEARFADGQAVTSADVLFSMKALMNPQVLADAHRSPLSTLQDVRVEGEYKIAFVLSEPYFLNDVALGVRLAILPKHFYDPEALLDPVDIRSLIDGSWKQGTHVDRVERFAEQFNQNFNHKALGSGSYVIENPERDLVTQQKAVLTRNPQYWARDLEGLPAAGYVDKVMYKVITNQDAAFIELTNGNLDIHTLQPLEFKEKSWSPNFNARFLKGVQYGNGFNLIAWNNHHPIFQDPRVRKAMTLLIDRQEMIRHLLFGLGEIVVGPISKFRPEYNHDLIPHPYDPDRALDLLAEAGWEDRDDDGVLDKSIDDKTVRFEFEFLIGSGQQISKDIALILQNELQDIGIVCHVRELDWSIFLQRVQSRDFDALTTGFGWGNPAFPPDLYILWHSSQTEGNGINIVGFQNAEADSLLEAYRREFDADRRLAYYCRLQEILYEEQPMTFLWQGRFVTAYSRRFRGVTLYPNGLDTEEWWVPAAEHIY